MTTQILKMTFNGEYKIIRDENDSTNPFRIYHTYHEFDYKERRFKKHRKCVAKYADLTSCMSYLTNMVYLY